MCLIEVEIDRYEHSSPPSGLTFHSESSWKASVFADMGLNKEITSNLDAHTECNSNSDKTFKEQQHRSSTSFGFQGQERGQAAHRPPGDN